MCLLNRKYCNTIRTCMGSVVDVYMTIMRNGRVTNKCRVVFIFQVLI